MHYKSATRYEITRTMNLSDVESITFTEEKAKSDEIVINIKDQYDLRFRALGL